MSLDIGEYYPEDPPVGSVAVDDDNRCPTMGTAGGQQVEQRLLRSSLPTFDRPIIASRFIWCSSWLKVQSEFYYTSRYARQQTTLMKEQAWPRPWYHFTTKKQAIPGPFLIL
jgi:hypothetical protein